MADVVKAEVRSRMMAGIRGLNTKPEMQLRRMMHQAGYRYRLHSKHLPGKPDLALPGPKIAIFVHGCFWHRHRDCHWCSTPASNPAFWEAKFEGNVIRDRRQIAELRRMGWRVAIIWECSLRGGETGILPALEDWIASDTPIFETEIVRARVTPSTAWKNGAGTPKGDTEDG